jgi:hypothetical protein
MNATAKTRKYQQNRIAKFRHNSSSTSFFNLLTSEKLLDKVEELLPTHRERSFPPTETLSMFLAQAMSNDRSCQQVVNKSAVQRLSDGLPPCSTRTGGYCRARQRLPIDMIKGLAQELGNTLDSQALSQWCWRERRIRIVDGTTVTMPDTAANQLAFPQQGGQKPGLGFPICRVVGITSLESGALLNAAIGRFNGKGGDEQTLLRSIQDSFKASDIVLADAFFATYFFIASMLERGVDIVMEQHGARRRSTDFRCGKRIGQKDHVITITKPKICPDWMSKEQYAAAPETIEVRELQIKRKTLVTTLSDPKKYTKQDLAVLYKCRWQVELDIRNIKTTLGMNILSCKTPDMIQKEIWVYLLAYNLLRMLMAQSASIAGVIPRQLSFKHCLQLWLSALPALNEMTVIQRTQLFLLMTHQRVGNRTGRIEPRAVKRRPLAYPLLSVPRQEARLSVAQFGHPKKLK